MGGWFTTLLNCAFPASNFPSQLISLSFLGGSLQGSRKKRCLWHSARLGGEVLQIWERHRVLWSLTAGMMSCFQETSPLGMWQKKQQVMNCGPPPGPEILEGGAGHRNQSGFSQEVCVAQGGGWSVKDWCLWSQGFPKALDTWNLSSLCHPPPGTRNAGIMGLNFPAGERIRYLCQENKVGASCSPFLLL